ncbi:MAG: hypothetical protein JWN70_6283 [Planctomycetaceae bacterium]|nr:hypothetical protein [Planctomycetaceae bacterium]
MLSSESRAQNAGISRRSAMQWASAGMGSSALLSADWLRAAATSSPTGTRRAKSVILIFNCGAPSHIDLWDPKPQAPDNVRGPYRPIETNVPGIYVSEMLPQLARHADKLAIVRSVHHRHSSHNSGMHWSIVGRPYKMDSTLINPSRSDIPSFGTLTAWLAQRDGYSSQLPPYVITPEPHCDSVKYITPGQYGSCLGSKFDPLVLNNDPNADGFRVPDMGLVDGVSLERQQLRTDLLGQLDSHGCRIETDAARDHDVVQAKALSMANSSAVSKAFDLSQEPTAVRERYGRHTWGQSHLLARRLVEAGIPFVTTVNGRSIIWDTHKDNFNRLEKKLVPPMQQGYTALLEDLSERGLLDSTLVVWMGDFGRTPLINKDAGRDHWPSCYTMVLAGGGIRGGQVVGESDKIGAVPRTRPISPADIHATVFTALGYDPHAITFQSADGRPMLLSEGEAIKELL